MRQKVFFFILFIILLNQRIDASTICPCIEAKVGYFFFSDAKMRKIYDKGGLDAQVSASYPIWGWLQAYASIEYLERHGKSLNAHQKTCFEAVPLSIGIQTVIVIYEKLHYYFTIGPRYTFAHVENDSSYVSKNIHESGFGGFANMGLRFFIQNYLFVSAFGEYSYQKMRFKSSKVTYGRNIQIGGFVGSGGIGFAF